MELSKSDKKIPGRIKISLLVLGVFLLIVMPRLWVVSETVTIDENKWLKRAALFRHALQTDNWQDTYQKEHPGVIVMWAGTIGLSYLLQESPIPLEQTQQLEIKELLQASGYGLLDGMIAARSVIIIVNGLVLTAVFVYARRLLDTVVAVLGILLIALSPFVAAHTHLLHLDGLVGSLMLLAVLAFVQYIIGRRYFDLIISGIATGMACLTKSPGFLLIPIISTIVLLIFILPRRKQNVVWSQLLRTGLFILAGWGLIAFGTFVILWPAMWVAPLDTLSRMVTAVTDYSIGGHSSPVFFNGEIYGAGKQIPLLANFYPITYLWRSTPITLIGLGLAIIAAIKGRFRSNIAHRYTMVALIVSFVFVFFFLNLGNKKFDRYLLPAYGPLIFIAAMGWHEFALWVQRSFVRVRLRLEVLILGLVICIQGIFLLLSYPYYLSFYNPLLGGTAVASKVMMIGWGEGLDVAADYLNAKSDIESIGVASWYKNSFAYFYTGEVIDIPSLPTPEQEAAILASDYLVIYIHQWQRDLPPTILATLEDVSPEHVIWKNGFEYVRIYKIQEK